MKRHPGATTGTAELSVCSVLLATIENQSVPLPILVWTEEKVAQIKALIDCGAGGEFISQEFALKNRLELCLLEKPVKVKNINGTLNKQGTILHYTRAKIWIGKKKKDDYPP